MSRSLEACGVDCSTCVHFERSECPGCSVVEGRVWWASYVSATVCPICRCARNEKGFQDCGPCADLPCGLWWELKDPSYTDEQHEAGVRARVENLRNQLG